MHAHSKKLTLASVQGGNWTANQISAITVILITVLILFCETTFIWDKELGSCQMVTFNFVQF